MTAILILSQKISSASRWPVRAPLHVHPATTVLKRSHRFIDRDLEYEDQKTNLTSLMQSYLSTMADLGAETWIIHGTLMGWWWNRKASSPASGHRPSSDRGCSDHALGFGCRRSRLCRHHAFLSQLLQHDHPHLSNGTCPAREELHAGSQSQVGQQLSRRFTQHHRRPMDRHAIRRLH